MRAIGTDTFAMSNPALTSILLWQFAVSYQKTNGTGAPLSLAYIVLPIVMSRHIVETFKGTNVRTGFLTWLIRSPQLTLQLPARVETTRDLTADALRFGIAYGLLTVSHDGTLCANQNAISGTIPRQHGIDERAQMLRIANHLGQWTSTLPEATVFYSIG
jgi:hypothetical protein